MRAALAQKCNPGEMKAHLDSIPVPTDADLSLKALLLFRKGSDPQIGESRIRLLEQIDALGSISAAAKAIGLSYKGAWDAVQALNNLSAKPLVLTQSGGRAGGVATVTAQGQALIKAYDALEGILNAHMVQLAGVLNNDGIAIEDLLRSLTMKTSARNAYRGTVTAIKDGAVNAEVVLKVSDGIELVAIVTRESVEELGLTVGKSAMALIKSSFVLLAVGHEPLVISARNRLPGLVSAIIPGAVNDEVVLDLGDGKSLTAIVTHESCVHLGFEVGGKAQALVKASHIILAVD